MSDSILLLEIDAWNGASVTTLRFGTHTIVTRASDTPANTKYLGRIVDAGRMQRSIYDGGGVLGVPQVASGAIILDNQDGALDYLYGYGFDGRAFRLLELPGRTVSLESATTLMSGVLDGIDSGNAWSEIRVRIRDARSVLDKALLTERYAGTTVSIELGTEGEADLTGKIKPRIFGTTPNIAPVLVNQYSLIYQVSVSGVSSIVVYDGGLALDNVGDYLTLAALQAATIPLGSYATCLALGLFKLGGSAVFEVTADVVEGSTLSERSAAKVARRILGTIDIGNLTIDEASFAQVHSENTAEVGVFVESDESALTVIGNVLQSIGAALIPTDDGVLQVIRIVAPTGTPIKTYTLRDLIGEGSIALGKGPTQEGDGVPAWSVVVNWGRVWQTQQSGQLADVSDARKAYLEKPLREAPAQDAAIKTAHPSAAEITVDTLLTTQADAEAEAWRRHAMHSVRRDYPTITVPRSRGNVGLGSFVSLKVSRFLWSAGKLFIVVGRNDDFNNQTIELSLWG